MRTKRFRQELNGGRKKNLLTEISEESPLSELSHMYESLQDNGFLKTKRWGVCGRGTYY